MEGAYAMFFDGVTVLFGRVTLILNKIIDGKLFVQLSHKAVTGDLRNNGCCGDGCRAALPFDQGLLRQGMGNGEFAVNKKKIRQVILGCKIIDSSFHGKKRCLQDIYLINFCMRNCAHTDIRTCLMDPGEKFVSFFRRELFGIKKEGMGALFWKDNSGGNNGPCEGTATDFIKSCNSQAASLMQDSFEMEIVVLL